MGGGVVLAVQVCVRVGAESGAEGVRVVSVGITVWH